jgi:hypothetical protein
MAVQFRVVRCAECDAEVDRVEFDPDAGSAQVRTVAEALQVSEGEAAKVIERQTGNKPQTNAQAAGTLAESIAGKTVTGRAKGSYACPNGHKGDLTVAEEGR